MFNRWFKRNRITNPSPNGHNRVSQKNSSLIELHQVTKKYESAVGSFRLFQFLNDPKTTRFQILSSPNNLKSL